MLTMNLPVIKNILQGNSPEHFPELNGKTGALFSNVSLSDYIKEEYLHDKFTLTQNPSRSIRSMSSGEQKKALLEHLLKKNPNFIIIDNPFDALDPESVNRLKNRLYELSKECSIIQIFKRKSDLLPFITKALRIDSGKIVFSGNISEYLSIYESNKLPDFQGEIPPPFEPIETCSHELIRFADVCVNYQEKAVLHNINWTVKKGEFWQLKGPNGSGKTTILSMINGDNTKAYGQNIVLFGKQKGTGENIWQTKKKIGYYTPSITELFSRRHTAEQMAVSGFLDSIGLYNKPSLKQTQLAHHWLEMLGLKDCRQKAFIELSQVQQRLVLIARAMVKHPPLLILDEPSNGLDDQSATLVTTLINKMASESATAIIYVSHRKEPNLEPNYIFELIPGSEGSTGSIHAT